MKSIDKHFFYCILEFGTAKHGKTFNDNALGGGVVTGTRSFHEYAGFQVLVKQKEKQKKH